MLVVQPPVGVRAALMLLVADPAATQARGK